MHHATSSAPLVASAPGLGVELRVDKFALPLLSFCTSKLWKKFCRTSCLTGSVPGLGVEPIVGEPRPARVVALSGGTGIPEADDRGAGLLDNFRAASFATPVVRGDGPPSISVSARSTVGKLKLLLPIGPTTPAAGVSKRKYPCGVTRTG